MPASRMLTLKLQHQRAGRFAGVSLQGDAERRADLWNTA